MGKFFLSAKHPNEKEILVKKYQVLCHDSKFTYIGQTKRDLKSLLDEHKRVIIKFQGIDKSTFCEHLIILDHRIDKSRTTTSKNKKD